MTQIDRVDVPKPRDYSMLSPKQIGERLVHAWIQKKSDGGCVIAQDDHLYSRRNSVKDGKKICYDKKFPTLVEELKRLQVPKPYLLQGEIIWRPSAYTPKEIREDVSGLCNMTDPHIKIMTELGGVYPEIVWFEAHLFGGHVLCGRQEGKPVAPYRVRYNVLHNLFNTHDFYFQGEPTPESASPHHHCARILQLCPGRLEQQIKEAIKVAGEMGWEGIVICDPDAGTELAVDADGVAPRPEGKWKWKPVYEADVVVIGFEGGTNSNKGLVGSLVAVQYRDGKEIHVGKVGGLTKQQKREFLTEKFPKVARVKITNVLGTGKYRMSFLGWHEDKQPNECIGYEIVNLAA